MQLYWLTDFYLSGDELFKLWDYRADVRAVSDYCWPDWSFCVSAQALSFTVVRYDDCPVGTWYYLYWRLGPADSVAGYWAVVAQFANFVCLRVLGYGGQCST